ncbi:hypothetical protein ACMV58_21735 [Citrobacter freundii]
MTTNNHPANGPVSLDRLHQISEILSKAAAQSDGGNLGYAMADAVKVIDGAIAEFEDQDNPRPVMTVKGELGFIDNLEKIIEERDEDIDIGQLGSSNYDALMLAALDAFRTSIPEPVVPEPKSYMDFLEQYPDMTVQDSIERSAGWTSCRAAMLQGSDGNSPVIADCWVLVPVEPTYQMCEAMGLPWESPRFPDRYKAMIAAAPHFREISNSSTKYFRENAETSTKCWCHTCRPVTNSYMRFVVCPDCGNKRCPHANDHRNSCTGSNEPGQEGSAYPAGLQQEVK